MPLTRSEDDPNTEAQPAEEKKVYAGAGGIPLARDPDKAWQEFAVQAVNGLYPRLRNGVDFAIGRKDLESDIELLEQAEGVNIDWGKVEEAARKLANNDPYGSDYQPKPPLHGGSVSGRDQGEVPYRSGESEPPPEPDTEAQTYEPKY